MTTQRQPEAPPPTPGKKAYAAPHLVEYGNIANLTGGSKGSFSDGKRRRKGGKGKGRWQWKDKDKGQDQGQS